MNLVAKEYVASQSADDPGVLILSRFAGAAYELDSALIVNPYDTEATAGAILRALSMTLDERKERWTAMMARLESNTIQYWCGSFLDTLQHDAVYEEDDALLSDDLETETARVSDLLVPPQPWRRFGS
jgi:trehalose 6-phosphate synthase